MKSAVGSLQYCAPEADKGELPVTRMDSTEMGGFPMFQSEQRYASLVMKPMAVQVLQADHWTAGFKSGYSCACDLCLWQPF